MDWHFESAMPGVAWPAISAPPAAAKLALLHQLERSQWLPAQRLHELQLRQLDLLVSHAATTVPYYRERWGKVGSAPHFSDLPLLGRRELQDNFSQLKSERLPSEHGAVTEVRTSGSTGAPKRVLKTQLAQFFWDTATLREHVWHRRDLSRKLAVIRRGAEGSHASWGSPTTGVFVTGPAVGLKVETDIDSQITWLQREKPGYLLTYPSVLGELARTCLARGIRFPGMIQARTLSEIVTPELRRLCREAWNVPVIDIYSSEEVGYVALQCPDYEHYHVQAENVLVEILDDEGRACSPGEVGRVVVTGLDNFATPLLRYDIGDYAEVGAPCPCGRGLPVLSRIAGRVRNMLVTADGKRYYPIFGQTNFLDVAPILQHQFVQTAFDRLEARVVTREPLSKEEQDRFCAYVEARMPKGVRVEVIQVESLPRGPGGKYEEFVSLVAAAS